MKKINIKQKYKIIEKLSTNMKKDHVSECSAECSYYTILSFIPFIILLITLIQYTSIAPQTLFDAISKLIPSSMNEMVLGIVQEVYSKSIGTISISIIFTIVILVCANVDYETYNKGADYLSWFLTPATVCLAIPLYEQWQLLKRNFKAVILGISAGVLTSLCTVLILAKLMKMTHREYVTLLPKSITTAIGMGVSEELGGYVTITVAVIVVTGVLGNIFGELICKIFKITEPISKGLALGASSHAIGTAKAIEMGEIEGAMSSLAVAVAGLLTVIFVSGFAQLI